MASQSQMSATGAGAAQAVPQFKKPASNLSDKNISSFNASSFMKRSLYRDSSVFKENDIPPLGKSPCYQNLYGEGLRRKSSLIRKSSITPYNNVLTENKNFNVSDFVTSRIFNSTTTQNNTFNITEIAAICKKLATINPAAWAKIVKDNPVVSNSSYVSATNNHSYMNVNLPDSTSRPKNYICVPNQSSQLSSDDEYSKELCRNFTKSILNRDYNRRKKYKTRHDSSHCRDWNINFKKQKSSKKYLLFLKYCKKIKDLDVSSQSSSDSQHFCSNSKRCPSNIPSDNSAPQTIFGRQQKIVDASYFVGNGTEPRVVIPNGVVVEESLSPTRRQNSIECQSYLPTAVDRKSHTEKAENRISKQLSETLKDIREKEGSSSDAIDTVLNTTVISAKSIAIDPCKYGISNSRDLRKSPARITNEECLQFSGEDESIKVSGNAKAGFKGTYNMQSVSKIPVMSGKCLSTPKNLLSQYKALNSVEKKSHTASLKIKKKSKNKFSKSEVQEQTQTKAASEKNELVPHNHHDEFLKVLSTPRGLPREESDKDDLQISTLTISTASGCNEKLLPITSQDEINKTRKIHSKITVMLGQGQITHNLITAPAVRRRKIFDSDDDDDLFLRKHLLPSTNTTSNKMPENSSSENQSSETMMLPKTSGIIAASNKAMLDVENPETRRKRGRPKKIGNIQDKRSPTMSKDKKGKNSTIKENKTQRVPARRPKAETENIMIDEMKNNNYSVSIDNIQDETPAMSSDKKGTNFSMKENMTRRVSARRPKTETKSILVDGKVNSSGITVAPKRAILSEEKPEERSKRGRPKKTGNVQDKTPTISKDKKGKNSTLKENKTQRGSAKRPKTETKNIRMDEKSNSSDDEFGNTKQLLFHIEKDKMEITREKLYLEILSEYNRTRQGCSNL